MALISIIMLPLVRSVTVPVMEKWVIPVGMSWATPMQRCFWEMGIEVVKCVNVKMMQGNFSEIVQHHIQRRAAKDHHEVQVNEKEKGEEMGRDGAVNPERFAAGIFMKMNIQSGTKKMSVRDEQRSQLGESSHK